MITVGFSNNATDTKHSWLVL